MRRQTVSHEFVEFIPSELVDGIVYISIPYATASHLCCCGCGRKVVTELSPAGWSLSYDGDTLSLYPSIGNWSFPCRSHYWITRNSVRWARRFTEREIALNRERDRNDLERHLAGGFGGPERPGEPSPPLPSRWQRIRRRIRKTAV